MKQQKKGDSKLVTHARRELEMAGLFEVREDYDGSIGRGVLALVKEFDRWSDNDSAKMQALHSCFNYIVIGDLLSRPTTDPAEWEEFAMPDGKKITRNIRNVFYVTEDMKSWKNLRTEETGMCVDHLTGKVLEGEKKEDGNSESTTDASDAGNGSDSGSVASEKETVSPGSTGAHAPVEGGELEPAVEQESSDAPSEKKTATKKSKSSKA